MIPFAFRFTRSPLFRERSILITLIVITGIVFYLLIYAPMGKKTIAAKNEIETLKTEAVKYRALLVNAGKNAKRLEEMMENYDEFQERSTIMRKGMPGQREIPGILRDISSPQPGLTFVSFKPSAIEDKGDYLRLPLNLELRGSFPSVGGFLSKLEGSMRPVGIDSISIARESQAGLLVRMEMSIYLLSEGRS